MRSYDEIYDGSRDEPAFSNSGDGDEWMSRWCERCTNDSPEMVDRGDGCPLILIAVVGRTPAEWFGQPNGSADRYHCVEFRDRDDPGEGGPQPVPTPPGQGTLLPREPFTGVRMYADVASTVTHAGVAR